MDIQIIKRITDCIRFLSKIFRIINKDKKFFISFELDVSFSYEKL